MKKWSLFLSAILMFWGLESCKKDSNGSTGGNGNDNYGPGSLFIRQGTEGITRLDMSTGILSAVLDNWVDDGWDIGWDGTQGVKRVVVNTDETRYLIFSTADGSIIREVRYFPSDNSGGLPALSPDGSKLALRPTLRDGLVILDMNGTVLSNVSGYGSDHEFGFLDPVTWAPDGTILFQNGNSLYRTSQDFSRAFKVKDMPFNDWKGYAAASPDGKKIALPLNKHIWLMNADGSDLHQITESNQEEASPAFSPDSQYIIVKANSRGASPGNLFGTASHLCLIPADGQVHKVYPGEDNRVIQVIAKGQANDAEGLGMAVVGDFVWR